MPDPEFRLTPKQHEVNGILGGTQTHTFVYGGGRSDKTSLITRAILIRAMRAPKSTHFILRQRFNAVVRCHGC